MSNDPFLLNRHFVHGGRLDQHKAHSPESATKRHPELTKVSGLSGPEARHFYESVISIPKQENSKDGSQEPEIHRCTICGSTLPEDAHLRQRHFSSLSHQVAEVSSKPKRPAALVIPPHNRGYRMLRSIGWIDPAFSTMDGTELSPIIVDADNDEKETSVSCPPGGLGPEGKGRRNPVATVLKRDRFGLGWPHARHSAKVTHFAAKDPLAVRHVKNPRISGPVDRDKRHPERRLQRDRAVERRIRDQLSLSDEQYFALYGAG